MPVPCPLCFPKSWALYLELHPTRALTALDQDRQNATDLCGRHTPQPEQSTAQEKK